MLGSRSVVRLQDAILSAHSALNVTFWWCMGDGQRKEIGDNSQMEKSATRP